LRRIAGINGDGCYSFVVLTSERLVKAKGLRITDDEIENRPAQPSPSNQYRVLATGGCIEQSALG
jgi:hypothetical protein